MPLLRLAYTTQFLIALIAIFVLWGQVGGQSHLDLVPWYLKLVFGTGAAYAAVKATAAAVGRDRPWNGRSLRWLGVMLALLLCCGLASYYAHLNEETDEGDQPEGGSVSSAVRPRPAPFQAAPEWPLHPAEVGQRAAAGPFGADFRDHEAVAFVEKLTQDIFELGSRVGTVQSPLIG
jgi:hypothetical protein